VYRHTVDKTAAAYPEIMKVATIEQFIR